MNQEQFFPTEPVPTSSTPTTEQPPSSVPASTSLAPRVNRPDRNQVVALCTDLDSALPDDHMARTVWMYVEGLDLSPLYDAIKSLEGHVGRSATDPALLMALWLYATLDGVGSARRLERLCQESLPYRWIAGNVPINHATLSTFRRSHPAVLDDLLTQSVAGLLSTGLTTMRKVSQDGVRIRANAGTKSFRREERLREMLKDAEEQVRTLKSELESNTDADNQRASAARKRVARERQQKISEALEELEKVKMSRKNGVKEKPNPKASTTDPQARLMRMANGGTNPAYNVQFAVDAESQCVLGLDVDTTGSDAGLMKPMLQQVEQRYGRVGEMTLVDGGYATLSDIEWAENEAKTIVYAPPKDPQGSTRIDRYTPRKNDSPTLAAWRIRMGTDEAKTIYHERAASVECVNAHVRNRGLGQFQVRGVLKVQCVMLLHALAHNLMRAISLTRARDQALSQAASAA